MHPVSLAEVEALARDHGLAVVRSDRAADIQGRPDVSWTRVALRLPDDGTSALRCSATSSSTTKERHLQARPLARALPRRGRRRRAGAEDGDEFVALRLAVRITRELREAAEA
jgi:hypothetical protein